METINWNLYTPPHSKSDFYQLMGKFFAEKIYQQQLPYLANSNTTFWILLKKKSNDVIGFSSFERTKKGIEIGEIYLVSNNNILWKKLASKTIREAKKHHCKTIYTAVNSEIHLNYFLYKGFNIYKKTKNYFFLQMEMFDNVR